MYIEIYTKHKQRTEYKKRFLNYLLSVQMRALYTAYIRNEIFYAICSFHRRRKSTSTRAYPVHYTSSQHERAYANNFSTYSLFSHTTTCNILYIETI